MPIEPELHEGEFVRYKPEAGADDGTVYKVTGRDDWMAAITAVDGDGRVYAERDGALQRVTREGKPKPSGPAP